uniref:Secreted protein n=1 Tax=Octopus bimaculoides TaxID=37653 RepID=A0A0L8GPT8_OCTBM
MHRKSCSLFISFLVFGTVLTNFCLDTAMTYCRKANKLYPTAKTDALYCKRLVLWDNCFSGVSNYCSTIIKQVFALMCT